MRLLLQFHNILIYVLLASAAVTATMQHWVDTAVITGVVVINAFIGFLQEGKAEKALDAIRKMLSLQANALRDGRRQAVSAETLVPGDVIFIESGDKVPADLRLLEVKNLQVQEAALTGELKNRKRERRLHAGQGHAERRTRMSPQRSSKEAPGR